MMVAVGLAVQQDVVGHEPPPSSTLLHHGMPAVADDDGIVLGDASRMRIAQRHRAVGQRGQRVQRGQGGGRALDGGEPS